MMLSRFIALFLAFVMCWSGFTLQDRDMSTSTVVAEQVETRPSGEPETPLASASTTDRQLDELPASDPAETLADLQTLLMDGAPVPQSGLVMARPRPYAALPRLAPYLDALQRPPCATLYVA